MIRDALQAHAAATQREQRLTFLQYEGRNGRGIRLARYRCQCGKEKLLRPDSVQRGDARSCGCLCRQVSRAINTTHGQSAKRSCTPEYRAWYSMKDRCNRPTHHAFEHYGGRGITVCSRWDRFENFYEDMGKRPSNIYSLDRINNDLGYFLENCRWATKKEQAANRRPCHRRAA